VVQQHQGVKNGVGKDDIEKVAYLSHENSPAFLDLVCQSFWDRIIEIAVIERVTAPYTFHCQPAAT
jgi:hypothetical protein